MADGKRLVSVIRWPNGFVNLIKVLNEHEGASIEQEVNWQVDDMCKANNIPREEVAIRVFEVSKVEVKDKL